MKTDYVAFGVLFTTILIHCCSTVHSQYDDFDPQANIDTSGQKIESREVKCLVCKIAVDEMLKAVSKVDPKKRADVGGYRMDSEGKSVTRTVQYSKSETYLTELMENICDKLEDYAKARYKKSKKLTVLKFMTDTGSMNPEMSNVDFVQDSDLNKSLKHFCLEVLEDNEEPFLTAFMKEETPKDLDIRLCALAAGYCDETLPEEDYVLEEDDQRDEL